MTNEEKVPVTDQTIDPTQPTAEPGEPASPAATAAPAKRSKKARLRGLGAGLLVGLLCVSLFAATLGVWSRRGLLKTDVWIQRVAPLASDPDVQAAIEVALTNQIMTLVQPEKRFAELLPERVVVLAGPLSETVRVFVSEKVEQFVASPTFATLWNRVALQAHTDAVRLLKDQAEGVEVVRGRVALNVLPIINRILVGVADSSPGILGERVRVPVLDPAELPDAARRKLSEAIGRPVDEDFGVITVMEGDDLELAQKGVAIFDRSVVLLIILTLLLIPAALLLSPRRRRTGLQIVVGAAFVLILVRRLTFVLLKQVEGLIADPVNAAAARATLRAFTDPLAAAAGWLLAGLGVVAVILLATAPYPWAVRGRAKISGLARAVGSASGGGAGPTTGWAADHVGALQAAGWAVLALGLWLIDLTWLSGLVLVVAVGLYELVLGRLAAATVADRAAADQ